jgi:hypothetical protein
MTTAITLVLVQAFASPLAWCRQVAGFTAGHLYSLTVTQDVASIARRPHGGTWGLRSAAWGESRIGWQSSRAGQTA